jgi:uncharacterized membrane protein
MPFMFGYGPLLLFGWFFRFLFLVLIIWLLVRILSHRHDHMGYWHGHRHWEAAAQDPRRIAAARYAAGQIDRADFDRITAALDATASTPAPPVPPVPPVPPAV